VQITLADLSASQRYHITSSLVVPRPIAWITTLNEDGSVNAAPFSYFQLMGENPPLCVLGIGRRSDGTMKDTLANIRRAREFVINLVTEENAGLMNQCATDFPCGMSEVSTLKLATEPSSVVKPPRLAVSPANFEAREVQTLLIGGNQILMGELLVVHVRDEFIDPKTLRIRTDDMHMVGRLQGGGGGYTRTRDRFEIERLTYEQWQAKFAGKSTP
jgi:flavin reductase (DIM6/NTAB) family NADH-FMN oxidoreductase RutF